MPIVSQGAAAGQMSSALWAATIISGSGDSPWLARGNTVHTALAQGLTFSSHLAFGARAWNELSRSLKLFFVQSLRGPLPGGYPCLAYCLKFNVKAVAHFNQDKALLGAFLCS